LTTSNAPSKPHEAVPVYPAKDKKDFSVFLRQAQILITSVGNK
jgi:hypothetical protein